MPTQLQIEASRANGRLSRGPKTEQGLRRSSMNAIKHGLSATRTVVCGNEDPAAYAHLVAAYCHEFQPQTPTETHMVEALAACQWRMARAVQLATSAYNRELDRQAPAFASAITAISESTRLWLVARAVLPETVRFQRHEQNLAYRWLRLYRQLTALRPPSPAATPHQQGGQK